jgi:type I restriction enzyme R subunit
MQQGLDYAETLDIPFVFSSNGNGFLFHDRTGNAATTETELTLADFRRRPSSGNATAPGRGWRAMRSPPSKPLLRRRLGRIPLLPGHRRQPHRRGRRPRAGPHPAGHGDRHRQDLHRLPDHLAPVEVEDQETHPVPGRPQHPRRSDPQQRLQALWSGHDQDREAAGQQGYEIYLSLYQAVTGNEEEKNIYKQFSPDFFDLIIIDECHRGSAAEDSAWREILDYFSGATQIGLTATPKETKEVSNIHYFGEPIYTYSLKQGIDDGFLAPYKVVRIDIDKDLQGWRPAKGSSTRTAG